MTSTTDYQPPAPTQQPAGIATASLVLGIVGFLVGICSVIGLVVGLVARGKAKRGEISPARVKAGIIVSAVATALQVVGWVVLLAVLAVAGSSGSSTTAVPAPAAASAGPSAAEPGPEAGSEAPAAEATDRDAVATEDSGTDTSDIISDVNDAVNADTTLVYEVTGSSGSAGSVSYVTDGFQVAQDIGATLPWTKEVAFTQGTIGANVVAQNAGGGDISCKITKGGEVVAENTSTGDYAVVTCTAS